VTTAVEHYGRGSTEDDANSIRSIQFISAARNLTARPNAGA
jgi:hypothetical protein